jgi:hypothetical protein
MFSCMKISCLLTFGATNSKPSELFEVFFSLDHPFWYLDCEYKLLKKISFVEFQICDSTKFEGFTQFCKCNLRLNFQVM